MAVNLYNLKKWYLMLSDKSILHVNQDLGKCFSSTDISGYYNNLTEKVIREPNLLKNEQLPKIKVESGETIYFPVGIFQYGLGAYDLYLTNKDEIYLKKFRQCVEWAVKNQEKSGAWKNFEFIYPNDPYGAMCQGEGASLLLRAYKQYGSKDYLDAAIRAIDFMLKPVNEGGTSDCHDDGLVLLEFTNGAAVLNGWIFSLFGLYDIVLATNEEKYRNALKKTILTLVKKLPDFDCGYWSMYDLNGKITSPFYHSLHIAQMQAMYIITGEKIFDEYAKRWDLYKNSFFNSKRAFIKKAVQKIME